MNTLRETEFTIVIPSVDRDGLFSYSYPFGRLSDDSLATIQAAIAQARPDAIQECVKAVEFEKQRHDKEIAPSCLCNAYLVTLRVLRDLAAIKGVRK